MKYLALVLTLALTGCGSTDQAQATTAKAQTSLLWYQKEMNDLVETLIRNKVAEQRVETDLRINRALRSITGPDGRADVQAINIIEQNRLRDYARIEQEAAKARARVVQANKNALNAAELLGGLQEYWKSQASTAETLKASEDAALELLQTYMETKDSQSPTTKGAP